VWLGMINNPNGTVGWGLSRNEWVNGVVDRVVHEVVD